MANGNLKEKLANKLENFRKPKVKTAVFENSLGRINEDFTIRVTNDKIVIKDKETHLKFTPNKSGEIIIEKSGDKLTVYVEKEKRG